MTPLKRRPDWPERLHKFIEGRRERPFLFGSNDCCLFAADGVLAQTDVDLAAEHRGYKTERKALKLIKAAGGLRAFASSLIEKKPGFAGRGDVALGVIEDRETFGLVIGNGHWCGPGPDGLVFRPIDEIVIAYGF